MNDRMENAEDVPSFGRGIALDVVLFNARTLGLEGALAKFGGALTSTEHELLKTLNTEELATLGALRDKLGPVGAKRNNNNNNNRRR